MTLQVKSDEGRKRRLQPIECLVCGADTSGRIKTSEHIASHRPEDFGLNPLGTVNSEFVSEVSTADADLRFVIGAGGESA